MANIEVTNDAVDQSILPDQTSMQEILEILEKGVLRRLFNPLDNPEASEDLLEWRNTYLNGSITVAFTSGVFDVFHANHRAYLLNTKIAAAPVHYERFYRDSMMPAWEHLHPEVKTDFLGYFLQHQELKLIVSVDGNMTVAARKGFNPAKDNVDRPVYDWSTRARDVLNATYPINESYLPIADVVTIHDNKQSEFKNTPHAGIMDIAAYLQPDVWPIYFESNDILQALPSDSRFSQTRGVRLDNHDYYIDQLLDGGFSTTRLTKRLLGSVAIGQQPAYGTAEA